MTAAVETSSGKLLCEMDDVPQAPSHVAMGVPAAQIQNPPISPAKKTPAPTPAPQPGKILSLSELSAERSRLQDLLELAIDCRNTANENFFRESLAKLPPAPAASPAPTISYAGKTRVELTAILERARSKGADPPDIASFRAAWLSAGLPREPKTAPPAPSQDAAAAMSEPEPKLSDLKEIETPDIDEDEEDKVVDGGEYEPKPIKLAEPGALTEIGNSMEFVNQFKSRCKFSFDSKRWYVWDNAQRWKPNHIGKVTRWGKSIVKRLYGYSVTITDEALRTRVFKHAERSNTKYGVNNLLDLAKSDLECSELDFDKDGYLLNLKDCTINLRTGKPHEQTSDDMLSKMAGVKYDPEATCPVWENHISKVFDGNETLINNFQEICGYVLAGIGNPSAAFFVLYGSGRNGKSVTLNTITHILGEYAVNIAPQSLQPMKPGQVRSDLMPTKGARVITCTEPGKGMKIDDGLIKSMTGGDQITARFLYGDPVSFSISGCLFLATNHKPRVSDQSTAMWTRIWMIPFKHYFDPTSFDSDPDIEKKLRKEASGILNWCLIGWKRYQTTGKLVKCKAISDETAEYQNQEDFLYDFLYQKKYNGEPVYKIDVHNRNIQIPAAELYSAYKQWCSIDNNRVMSATSFGREISSRFEKVHTRACYVYLGICLVGKEVQTDIERRV